MKHLLFGIFLFFTGFVFSQELKEQQQFKTEDDKAVQIVVSWSTAVPMGELTHYTNVASGRGFQFEINQYINDKWTYGATFGWQSFFDKSEVWYIDQNSIMSGIQRNYINSLSFTGSSKYYFSTSVNGIKAYLNLELGASVIENFEIFGLYEYRELYWHWAVIPGMGIDIPASSKFGVQIYFKYPNLFKTKSSIHYSWLNTGLGLYYKITD
jgi:hypothetical protein